MCICITFREYFRYVSPFAIFPWFKLERMRVPQFCVEPNQGMMLDTVVLIGIAAGGLVFVGTILMVYFLLKQGGSFDRMKQEAAGMPARLGEQKPLLYDDLLSVAKSRAIKPAALEAPLDGKLVRIRNFVAAQDTSLLHDVSSGKPVSGVYGDLKYDADEMIWRHLRNGPFNSVAAFSLAQCTELPDNRHYVIEDADCKQPVGMVTLCCHSPRDLRVEIGDVWVAPALHGSGAACEAILLLLRHLFALKYRRVEWRCDGHNVRARRFAHSMGFTFEGVLRKHSVIKDCNCDTVIFAVLNSEWPLVEPQITSKVVSAIAARGDQRPTTSAFTKKKQ